MGIKSFKFNSICVFVCLIIIILLFDRSKVFSQANLSLIDKIKFKGKILAEKDISAIGFVGKYILLGADEGSKIQVLKPNKKRSKYRVDSNIELLVNESKSEVDIEGIAVGGNTVYVVGSHSTNNETNLDKNSRKNVFRFKLNPDTGALESDVEKASLQAILSQDKTLSRFTNMNHSDNGVDIEGIAVKNNQLYFGFRTPVLENNYVPIIVAEFEDLNRTDKYQLHRIDLGGNGIRDLVAVNNGFLILTDETGNNGDDYRIYFWDGSDRSPQQNTSPTAEFLSDIPAKKNTRAEGLTIVRETDSVYRILLVYDGVDEGNPTIFEIYK